ncbi:helix-turn-helix transcriptional regulator [Nostoc sp. FACHB-152]|uniref:helix-turn-helix transcriptional regulator n=1 Tax=Nostoc sp. FACHB-152 TaxID=2692837 RepID=UPI00168A1CCF|nr:AraC family transcriptional regulator [Nostoc sp. FACHB-152]MBD2452088.1 helix-turn-helix transcriptional regulator [Nostoc sp. FACHB-152]
MRNILLIDEHPEAKEILIKCLDKAEPDVINTENGIVNVKLKYQTFSNNTENKKSNAHNSIFPTIPRMREVFEFIELNYHQNIKLKEVAQAVGYSPAYLTDLVRRITGRTVNNWIIDRRLKAASYLLLETNYSVDDIALKVGYQNINHFYCQFRNRYQNTPRAWRAAQRFKVAEK